jgi:hypothetical protein
LILEGIVSRLDRREVLAAGLLPAVVLLLLVILLQLMDLGRLRQIRVLVVPAHVHQILQHDLLVGQFAVVVLPCAPVLLLLVQVELLQLLVNLLCVHLIDVDVGCVLVQVRCL